MWFATIILFSSCAVIRSQLYPQFANSYLPQNGDFRSAQGTIVDGVFTVIDPTGKKRTIHYTNDGNNGFKADEVHENFLKSRFKEQSNDNTTLINSNTTASSNDTISDEEAEKQDHDQHQQQNIQYIPVPVFPQNFGTGFRSYYPYNPYYFSRNSYYRPAYAFVGGR